MRVVLFTHSQDIDGMGCAVLAKKAFGEYTLVPTKTFDITSNVKKYIDNKEIYTYDKIYVTDLCIKEPLLEYISKDEILREKLIVLDHHKTEIEEGNNKYDFVNIIVEENGIKQSGTSLFYKYLIDNNLIKRTSVLDEFVEWTRQYDVYDWYSINNQKARYLHILFETLGNEKYLELIRDKVDNYTQIEYTEYEMNVINSYLTNLDISAKRIIENIVPVDFEINGTKCRVGYVRCEYKYRNDLNEYVKKDNKFNIDAIGMIMTDIDTVSYRRVNPNIDISIVGKYFGGKGHIGASSNSQNNEKFIQMVKENNI